MLPPLPDTSAWIHWWSSLYANNNAVSSGVTYLHLAGLVVGGGAALTTDRQILHAWRHGGVTRPACLEDVSAVHGFVVGGLLVVIVSGVLMTFADWDTFRHSRLFWAKLAGVGVLVLNGAVLALAERSARLSEGRRGWSTLATVSTLSFLLWLTVLGLGTWLKTAA